MTYKEAIQVLSDTNSRNTGIKYHEALVLAIKSIEKQIPALPYNGKNCPVCDFHIGNINGEHFYFCPMCGQRMDENPEVRKPEE